MISIPLEDLVFIVCVLVGGGLLLITVLVDDVLGGIFDALHSASTSAARRLMPLMLSFVSMFGVGGLFATQVLDVHGGQAALRRDGLRRRRRRRRVCSCSGFMKRSEAPRRRSRPRTSSATTPSSAVAIPAHPWGSVYVKAEGQTHEFSATSPRTSRSGRPVRVTGTAGNGLSSELPPRRPSPGLPRPTTARFLTPQSPPPSPSGSVPCSTSLSRAGRTVVFIRDRHRRPARRVHRQSLQGRRRQRGAHPAGRATPVAGDGESGLKVVRGGGVIVLPLFHKLGRLKLTARQINVNLADAVTRQGIKVAVQGVATFKIGADDESIRNAAERFLESQRGGGRLDRQERPRGLAPVDRRARSPSRS